jgi:hypothetical protein
MVPGDIRVIVPRRALEPLAAQALAGIVGTRLRYGGYMVSVPSRQLDEPRRVVRFTVSPPPPRIQTTLIVAAEPDVVSVLRDLCGVALASDADRHRFADVISDVVSRACGVHLVLREFEVNGVRRREYRIGTYADAVSDVPINPVEFAAIVAAVNHETWPIETL